MFNERLKEIEAKYLITQEKKKDLARKVEN
jgi:hypothetical protein